MTLANKLLCVLVGISILVTIYTFRYRQIRNVTRKFWLDVGWDGLVLLAVCLIMSVGFLVWTVYSDEKLRWYHLLNGFSTSFLASFVFFLFYIIYTSNANKEGLKGELNYGEYTKKVEEAQKHIWVYVTYLRCLTCHAEWTDEKNNLKNALKKVSDGKLFDADIRFLILAPNEAAKRRQENLVNRGGLKSAFTDVPLMIRQNLWTLYCFSIYEKIEKLKIHIYDDDPTLSILRIDETYSIAQYENNRFLHETRRYEAGQNTGLGIFVNSIFDNVWKLETSERKTSTESLHYRYAIELKFPLITGTDYKSFPWITNRHILYAIWVESDVSHTYYDDISTLQNGCIFDVNSGSCAAEMLKITPTPRSLRFVDENDIALHRSLLKNMSDRFGHECNVERFLRIGEVTNKAVCS